ncbi:MAG: family 43 glycosylhydrolase [Lachnospiraceae bacterium]|nr:family 43 glycosylhydrolase [Lachnospiraceae bacterium]
MKTKQAVNPYLPSWEYVPDAEPHVVGDRVYIYGSHDLFNGINFCLGDYVCWSAPVDDLGNWTYHGVIFKREQDPAAPRIRTTNGLAAPDMVVGDDGRYYLYYFMGGTKMISVAVCDEPAGKYEFYGYVHYQDGTPIGKRNEPFQFDPGCLKDDDGRLYLYTGFAFGGNPILLDGSKPTEHGPMCFEIDTKDMLTVISGDELHYIGVKTGEEAKGTPYEQQPFGEASSMRKFGDTYYFIYSSLNSHNLCYATSKSPTEGFEYGGILVSCGDIGLPGVEDVNHARNSTGNTHGSLIEIGGKYYIFYHRHTNRKQSSRQACAEEIRFEDGKFYQAEMTSCGLNGGPLKGEGEYPTAIACNVYGKNGTRFLSMIKMPKRMGPFITQSGKDRESGDEQYISNFCTGCTVGFKYFDLSKTKEIAVHLQGYGDGCAVTIRNKENGPVICSIPVRTCKQPAVFKGKFETELGEKEALYFSVEGKGGTFDFTSFELK